MKQQLKNMTLEFRIKFYGGKSQQKQMFVHNSEDDGGCRETVPARKMCVSPVTVLLLCFLLLGLAPSSHFATNRSMNCILKIGHLHSICVRGGELEDTRQKQTGLGVEKREIVNGEPLLLPPVTCSICKGPE